MSGRSLGEAFEQSRAREGDISASDRASAQNASYGALRHWGELEAVRAKLVPRPTREPSLDCLLNIALFQLAHSAAAPHAVVSNAVDNARKLSLKPWAPNLVNGVLRSFLRERDLLLREAAASLEGRFSYPSWWIEKVQRDFPAHWEAVLNAGNHHPPLTLRVNRRRTSVEDYQRRLEERQIASRRSGEAAITLRNPVGVAEIPGFVEGDVSVQDLAAQYAAPLLDLVGGMRVLDACAAPGGKTGHILEQADVELLALEKDPKRIHRIAENLSRLGLHASFIQADAGEPVEWWNSRSFDRVLLDAPCTGSGVVKRHPDIKWLRRPQDIASFAIQQARLLERLWHVLAKGGKLLYVTCSVFAEENHEQIAHFLSCHADAVRLPVAIAQASGGQLLPDELSDGFFYALLQKT